MQPVVLSGARVVGSVFWSKRQMCHKDDGLVNFLPLLLTETLRKLETGGTDLLVSTTVGLSLLISCFFAFGNDQLGEGMCQDYSELD